MHPRRRRRLELRADRVRALTTSELQLAAGGMRGTTSENDPDGGGPCAGEYSWTCSP